MLPNVDRDDEVVDEAVVDVEKMVVLQNRKSVKSESQRRGDVCYTKYTFLHPPSDPIL